MSTSRELADEFADVIRRSKRDVQKSRRDLNIRTASAGVPSEFERAVESVLAEVNNLVLTGSRQPASESTKQRVLSEIDEALKVRPRTMYMIKKGSVESLLAYQQALLDLYQQIEFV